MAAALQVETGRVALFDHIERNGPMWAGTGPRMVAAPVNFGSVFDSAPGVNLSIGSIDAASQQNLRLRIEAREVTSEGFSVEAPTWGDTRIGRLAVNWIAVGTVAADDEGGWDV